MFRPRSRQNRSRLFVSAPITSLLVALLGIPLGVETANAGEIEVHTSLAGGVSNRDGDGVGAGTIRGRYQLMPHLSACVSLLGAFAADDERTIGAIFAMGQLDTTWGRWRPAMRLGFSHQHETPRDQALANPIAVAFGVAEAIRHRTGAVAEAGMSFDLTELKKGMLFVEADLSALLMFDSNGPRSYVLVGAGLGVRFD